MSGWAVPVLVVGLLPVGGFPAAALLDDCHGSARACVAEALTTCAATGTRDCADVVAAAAEDRMFDAFAETILWISLAEASPGMAAGPNVAAFAEAQEIWLIERGRRCGSDPLCTAEAALSRARELEGLMG